MAYIGKQPAAVALASSDITDGIVSTAKIADTAITNAKLNADIISADTALGAEPADTDEFLVSDAGTLKRMDYSHIKGGGKVLQVVQNTQGTVISTTSTSWADMGWDQAITPSATSSKILVFGTLMLASSNHGNFRAMRASTVIGAGSTASSSRENVSGYANCDGNTCRPQPFCILDSPSSTSSLTYKFQWIANSSATVYLNRTPNDTDAVYGSRSKSSLTLMEIGA